MAEAEFGTSPRRAFSERLTQAGFSCLKRLGQNFLYEPEILEGLVHRAGISEGDWVLEIGAGAGTFTAALAKAVGADGLVLSYEIDGRLDSLLREVQEAQPQVELIMANALEADFQADIWAAARSRGLAAPTGVLRVAANVPYYVSSKIIRSCLAQLPEARSYSFLLDSAMAERLLAQAGKGKAYGPLAVFITLQGRIEKRWRLSPKCFYPAPQVDSLLFHIESYKPGELEPEREQLRLALRRNWQAFQLFVDSLFRQRRKQLEGVLSRMGDSDQEAGPGTRSLSELLAGLGLSGRERAEDLDPWRLASLYLAWTGESGWPDKSGLIEKNKN